mmetsp:Transcript_786/g.1194  ORF Transcript_786/g.1194 Transcript_786/m.1194 type:complete len:304 (+) Transcript_786:5696-6607(+)
MGREGDLNGMEIFFFADNSTSERAFFKGTSKSKLLHELVIRLRDLEMKQGCLIRLCHVAGTRMIQQGSDGLSRGNLTEGVMSGKKICDFIPIHQNAIERFNPLLAWLRSWIPAEENLQVLEPEDWFEKAHGIRGYTQNVDGIVEPISTQNACYLWNPAPDTAETSLEQLRFARQKRYQSTHVFVCPHLLEPYWRSHLHNVADLVCEIPVGNSFWPNSMHEPLILGICFPFIHSEHWQLKGCVAMLEMARELRSLWKTSESAQRSVLRELWSHQRQLAHLLPGLVQQVLFCEDGFKVSHSGTSK